MAFKHGARSAFRTEGGVYSHGDEAHRLACVVREGMTPRDAIQVATINNAKLR